MMFENIIGNKGAIRQLTWDIKRATPAQAYVFTGPEGVGKFTMAVAFAKVFFPDFQGSLKNHPDFHTLTADGLSIKKNQVEELITEAQKTAFQDLHQIFIIRDFDKVTVEGQNALLKTLEEPKPGVYLLLTTSRPGKVLPTILSRCREVRLVPPTGEEVRELLRRRDPNLTEEECILYGKLSQGNMKEALDYVEDPRRMELRQKALRILESLAKGADPFSFYPFFEEHRGDFSFLAKQYRSWFRDLRLLPYGEEPVNSDLLKKDGPGPFLTDEGAMNLWRLVEETEFHLERNGNFQLHVENMLLKIQEEYRDRSGRGTI